MSVSDELEPDRSVMPKRLSIDEPCSSVRTEKPTREANWSVARCHRYQPARAEGSRTMKTKVVTIM